MARLLVTGVTGSVGLELLRLLLKDRGQNEAFFLIRAESEESLGSRWAELLAKASQGSVTPAQVPEFQPLAGDLRQPSLGFSPQVHAEVVSLVDTILHSAAHLSFVAAPRMARAVNLEGTRNVLALAERAPRLERFAQVSTAFVAGRRKGLILEHELEHAEGFVNAYEESKHEAEQLVRSRMHALPLSVYRLPLLLGRASDGYVHDPGAVHLLLEAIYQGLCPVLPAVDGARLDVLPTDYVAEQLFHLVLRDFKPSTTYHLTSGAEAVTLRQLVDLACELYLRLSRSWRMGAFASPEHVDFETYSLFVESVQLVRNRRLGHITRILDSCSEHLRCSKIYDTRLFRAQVSTPLPDFETYFPRVIASMAQQGLLREPPLDTDERSAA